MLFKVKSGVEKKSYKLNEPQNPKYIKTLETQ